jgi:MFS family permease
MNAAAAPLRIAGPAASAYAWVVFALSFGLLISDYMARQVLNAVFPLLKAEWALSDAQLGTLSGVVALMVGLLTFPLSLLADRLGRVKSLVVMAVLWSLATLLCAVASSYPQMLAGRILVGVGEAAYGSVGIAVVISVFPRSMRATLSAAFMAGGIVGQVLGVGVGGAIAASLGWRWAFAAIALGGLILALVYALVVREKRIRELAGEALAATPAERAKLSSLVGSRSVICAYVGSGLQLYVAGALPAWLPSYFNRYYALPVDKAAGLAALFLMVCGAGMVLCGMLSDRLAKDRPHLKIRLAVFYCLLSASLTGLAFQLPAGGAQLAVLGLAIFVAAGTTGPAGAMVANLTPLALHGTAFATLTLANNLLGLAPGPIVTGRLADWFGLLGALQVIPVASLLAAFVFFLAGRFYLDDLAKQDSPPVA